MTATQEVVEIFPDVHALSVAAAQRFALLATQAVKERGIFAVALSGGSTPKALYQLMATDPGIRGELPWSKTHFFFGDERHVPPEAPDNNFRMANEAMFHAVQAESLQIHRIRSEVTNASEAADQYERDLRQFFESRGLLDQGWPRFDLILLGMGPDGHTASLFPNSSGLHETERWVIANWVEKFKTNRITLTFPVINSAAEIVLLTAGAEKASILAKVLQGGGSDYPVQRVSPRHGMKRWMLDAAAAADLPTSRS